MKLFFKRLFFVFMVMPALAAGIFVFGGWAKRLPRGTFVNGVDVGGLSAVRAAAAVREDILSDLKGRKLEVRCGQNVYSYSYPEISFKDNLSKVLSSVRGAGDYGAQVKYYLNGLDAVVSGICAAEFSELAEPEAYFNGGAGEPFYYEAGRRGVIADGERLRGDMLSSLENRGYGTDFAAVNLSVKISEPKQSLEMLRRRTVRLSSYTTYFDGGNAPRVSNIKLAGEKISGCILGAGKSFSFNSRVGARTVKNGFRRAKIIEDGRFVYGTGGGVCQVSTTLYNAALLAGLKVTEYHPHSLAVSYVSPSRDAMVSGTYSDLKFRNTTNYPAYIRVLTGSNYIRCEVYGMDCGAEYSLDSVVVGEEEGAVISECYLNITRGGVTERKLIRKDKYLPARTDAPQPSADPVGNSDGDSGN